MKTTFYSLVVLSPEDAWFRKVRISREAVLILAMAFILSFFATVALLLSLPYVRTNDDARSHLAAENQELRIENRNAALHVSRLSERIARVEQTSNRIKEDLIEAER